MDAHNRQIAASLPAPEPERLPAPTAGPAMAGKAISSTGASLASYDRCGVPASEGVPGCADELEVAAEAAAALAATVVLEALLAEEADVPTQGFASLARCGTRAAHAGVMHQCLRQLLRTLTDSTTSPVQTPSVE